MNALVLANYSNRNLFYCQINLFQQIMQEGQCVELELQLYVIQWNPSKVETIGELSNICPLYKG